MFGSIRTDDSCMFVLSDSPSPELTDGFFAAELFSCFDCFVESGFSVCNEVEWTKCTEPTSD